MTEKIKEKGGRNQREKHILQGLAMFILNLRKHPRGKRNWQ